MRKLCLPTGMVAMMLGVQVQEKVPVTGKAIKAATKAPLEGVTIQVKELFKLN